MINTHLSSPASLVGQLTLGVEHFHKVRFIVICLLNNRKHISQLLSFSKNGFTSNRILQVNIFVVLSQEKKSAVA
jgi:hypothetical protein